MLLKFICCFGVGFENTNDAVYVIVTRPITEWGKYWVYPRMVYKMDIVIPPGIMPDWRNFQNSNIKLNDCWSENDSETKCQMQN